MLKPATQIIIIFCLAACTGTTTTMDSSQQLKVRKSGIAILPLEGNDWFGGFEGVEPSQLSDIDLESIELILRQAVKENNEEQAAFLKEHNETYPKEQWEETGFELKLKGYRRQYIPYLNKAGEKEVWVNLFCDDWGAEDWKTSILVVHDGGNCYFNLKINLASKTYYDLAINGYA